MLRFISDDSPHAVPTYGVFEGMTEFRRVLETRRLAPLFLPGGLRLDIDHHAPFEKRLAERL